MSLRRARLDDLGAMVALHASAFETPWSDTEIESLLTAPGGFAVIAEGAGFILCRVAFDEAEVLTLAVDPAARRQGVGATLVEAAAALARAGGAASFFLEVAADNDAALALYAKSGFACVGTRRGYYARPAGPVDAVVMRRALNSPAQ